MYPITAALSRLRPQHHLERLPRFGDEAEALLGVRERKPVGDHLLRPDALRAKERHGTRKSGGAAP